MTTAAGMEHLINQVCYIDVLYIRRLLADVMLIGSLYHLSQILTRQSESYENQMISGSCLYSGMWLASYQCH